MSDCKYSMTLFNPHECLLTEVCQSKTTNTYPLLDKDFFSKWIMVFFQGSKTPEVVVGDYFLYLLKISKTCMPTVWLLSCFCRPDGFLQQHNVRAQHQNLTKLESTSMSTETEAEVKSLQSRKSPGPESFPSKFCKNLLKAAGLIPIRDF